MRSAATAALLALGLLSCSEFSPGVDPPADKFAFPAGLLLDPRISSEPTGPCMVDDECGSGQRCASGSCRSTARWMLVTNANSDLRYNAGSLIPVDLDKFWTAIEEGPILPADSKLSANEPCRKLANLPQAIECEESYFALPAATTYFGNFPGPIEPWDRDTSDAGSHTGGAFLPGLSATAQQSRSRGAGAGESRHARLLRAPGYRSAGRDGLRRLAPGRGQGGR